MIGQTPFYDKQTGRMISVLEKKTKVSISLYRQKKEKTRYLNGSSLFCL